MFSSSLTSTPMLPLVSKSPRVDNSETALTIATESKLMTNNAIILSNFFILFSPPNPFSRFERYFVIPRKYLAGNLLDQNHFGFCFVVKHS